VPISSLSNSQRPLQVFIVAAIRLYRDGLAATLGNEGLSVVGAHRGGSGIGAVIAAAAPDVVLLDMATTGSYAIVREVLGAMPDATLVALGVGATDKDLLRYAEAGISGYIASDASVSDLVAGIQQAARGELICPPSVFRDLLHRVATLSAAPPRSMRLTERERQIAGLLRQDFSNKEIAIALSVGESTVKHHVHNVLRRLGVRRRQEAVVVLKRAERGVPTLLPRSGHVSLNVQR
jgi:two-component system nitrate/nitrite response regulator NarL